MTNNQSDRAETTSSSPEDLSKEIKRVGLAAGLDAIGIADAEPFVDTRRILETRRAAGLSDSMQFTYRNPERSTTPSMIVPTAASLVVAAWSYPSTASPGKIPADRSGRVAAYAWQDHYADLRAGLSAVADSLRGHGWTARIVIDDNALVDRPAAVRAGLGWFGKNSNVLLPDAGSFFVLGSVVTDAVLVPDQPLDLDCGTCRRCLDGCPTEAIIAPGVVDAGRCLAWLLQKEGMFPAEFREALGDRIYGCDDCQTVCPPNRQAVRLGSKPHPTPESIELTEADHAIVDLVAILGSDDEAIKARHGRWYIPRRDMNYVRRNALIALANSAVEHASREDDHVALDIVSVFIAYLDHEVALLRAHAVWCVRRIGRPDLVARVADDPSDLVQREIRSVDDQGSITA